MCVGVFLKNIYKKNASICKRKYSFTRYISSYKFLVFQSKLTCFFVGEHFCFKDKITFAAAKCPRLNSLGKRCTQSTYF